jgi:RNA polymerase sigma-70 factor (ECF subfamily)
VRDREGNLIGWGAGGRRVTEFEREALVHLDALHHFALRLTRNRAEAEDVVQETCLRAFRAFDRFDPGTNCRAWLFTILRNVFLNRVRSQERDVLETDLGSLDAVEPTVDNRVERSSPEEQFLQSVLHGDVDRAIQTLPLMFREAVVLVDLEGSSYREAAEVLGCPLGTVMSRLFRGRALLRRALRSFAREHGYVKDEE